MVVYTIGHSNHSIERFLELLREHQIAIVADVRSQPYSRMQPQFNQPILTWSLKNHSMDYLFLGKQLGARSEDRSCYEQGRVQYRRLAKTPLFKEGLDRVIAEAELRRLVLLCAEKEPLDCHRTILVARELVELGVRVQHIHADGHLESHDATMVRLRRQLGMAEPDMFLSEVSLTDEAYKLQEARIAYVEKSTGDEREDTNL